MVKESRKKTKVNEIKIFIEIIKNNIQKWIIISPQNNLKQRKKRKISFQTEKGREITQEKQKKQIQTLNQGLQRENKLMFSADQLEEVYKEMG